MAKNELFYNLFVPAFLTQNHGGGKVGRNRKEVELEKQRVLGEIFENGGGQLRYADVAKNIESHPAFAGVKFAALAEYVRHYALQKSHCHPTNGSVLKNGERKGPVYGSGFDATKNSIQFRKGVNFEEVKRISDAVEQIRPHYERLEIENQKLLARLGDVALGKTAAKPELSEARCYDCESYRAECDAKVSKVNGDNSQLIAKIHEQENQLDQMRNRLRKNALAV